MKINLNFETIHVLLLEKVFIIFVQHFRLICMHSFIMKEYKCNVMFNNSYQTELKLYLWLYCYSVVFRDKPFSF